MTHAESEFSVTGAGPFCAGEDAAVTTTGPADPGDIGVPETGMTKPGDRV